MTIPSTLNRMPLALCMSALCLLTLGTVACTDSIEPEEQTFVEALQLALDAVHAQDSHTLDDIATEANDMIDDAVGDGDLRAEDALRLRGWVGRRLRLYKAAVEGGRLTLEEACAAFREDIVGLAQRLSDHAEDA